MEDILASIRRILSEDEAAAAAAPGGPEPDVLALDESMLVHPGEQPPPPPAVIDPLPIEPPSPPRVVTPEPPPPALVAPEAAAAAAASMDALMRTMSGGRAPSVLVTRAGTTLEDIVRDELRPVLKAWLDANLPPLVERLVRAEIARVVGRPADL